MIGGEQITALVLAGGRGARIGGADKGLQPFRGQPLVSAVLARLSAQTLPPARIAINANRNLRDYAAIGAAFDAPVWPDGSAPGTFPDGHPDELSGQTPGQILGQFPGPLAGILTGLTRAATPYLLVVPCDAPLLPLALCAHLARALQAAPSAQLAVACEANDATGSAQWQPLFCLLRRDEQGRLASDLSAWLGAGQHKVRDWIARQRHAIARFNLPDTPSAFANTNTLEQLRQMEDG